MNVQQLTSALASRHAKRADPARVAGRAFLDVVAHVPDRTVVARVDRRLCVVFPTHRVLGSFAFHQHGLLQRQLAERVLREPAGKPLPGEVRRPSE